MIIKLQSTIKYIFCVLTLLLAVVQFSYAQQNKVGNTQISKATKDSITQARAQFRDSLEKARATTTKEKEKFAKYKNSKKFTDSVAKLRTAIRDSIKYAGVIGNKKENALNLQDDIVAYRDSVTKAKQNAIKQREKLAKYKSSKKYADSIAIVRAEYRDSIKFSKNISAEQNAVAKEAQKSNTIQTQQKSLEVRKKEIEARKDSITKAREKATEIRIAGRKKISDSISALRKVKSDSAVAKKERLLDKIRKGYKSPEDKRLEEAMKKHEKKKANYSNQNFLKKPWTLVRRVYHNTTTRYNYFYNARNVYRDVVSSSGKQNRENYDSLLKIDALGKEQSGNAMLDTVIRKSYTGIQLHDPRSKWSDNSYFLIGKAYYAKGDYDNALLTFQYIASEFKPKVSKKKPAPLTRKEKLLQLAKDTSAPISIANIDKRKGINIVKHFPIRNDALLWIVKSYIQQEAYNDALSFASILKKDTLFPKRLRGELDALLATIYIATSSQEQAIASLEDAIKDKGTNTTNKRRMYFLLGQLLAIKKDYEESSKKFEKVIGMHPSVDMDFYSKLNIAKNTCAMPGANLEKVEKTFQDLIKDGKYTEFLDKAYLTLGIVQSKFNLDKAIVSLRKSITKANGKKDICSDAFCALGDIYFSKKEYKSAKVGYDSAKASINGDTQHPRYTDVTNKISLLSDLVKELDVISLNDSLLTLAKLSPKDQLKAIKKGMARERKLKEEELANKIENNPLNATVANNAGGRNWYFSNPTTVSSGGQIFKQKWGNRANVDNWARASATRNETTNADSTLTNEEKEDETLSESERFDELRAKQLQEAIPNTPEKEIACKSAIENSLYNIGVIFYAGLEDDNNAVSYLNQLLNKYPNTSYKEQAYYTLYLAHKRLANSYEADKALDALKDNFTDSKYVKLATDSNYLKNAKNEVSGAMAYYDDTYKLFVQKKYAEVPPRVLYAKENYPENKLIAKFDLLNAMSTASLKDFNTAKTQLEDLIGKYAGKEEATLAQDILALLSKKDATDEVDKKSSTPSLPKETSFDKQNVPNGYAYNPDQTHYFCFALKILDSKLNPMRSAFIDYNSLKHSDKNIEITLYLVSELSGILVFKSFKSEKEAKKYLKDVENNKILYGNYKSSDYNLMVISQDNYTYLQATRDLESYLKFYKKNY